MAKARVGHDGTTVTMGEAKVRPIIFPGPVCPDFAFAVPIELTWLDAIDRVLSRDLDRWMLAGPYNKDCVGR